jgi:thiamine-monophosphate kinase
LAKKADEISIINTFLEVLGQPKLGYSRIGDDVAHLPYHEGKVVVKCDMLVGETDMPRGMTYREAARKALVSVVSDFAAKGVRPEAALVSLGIPPTLTLEDVRELALGVRDARDEFGFQFLGGDTNEAKDLVIDCIMIGYAKQIVERRGAKVGDAVVVTGDFGYTGTGLYILSKYGRVTSGFAGRAVSAVLKPKPPLELGLALAEKRLMSSSIDSSDGLAISLYTLAEASSLKIVVYEMPAASGLIEFCEEHGLNPEELVFYSGEEYEIVFTTPKERLDEVQKLARALGRCVRVIGEVQKGEATVEYISPSGKKALERRGWVHLADR